MKQRKANKITKKMLADYLGLSSQTVYQFRESRFKKEMDEFELKIKKGEVKDPRDNQ